MSIRWGAVGRAAVLSVGAGIAALFGAGLPTAVVANPWFTRMTPVRSQDYIVLGITVALAGALGATYAFPTACRSQQGTMTAGGFLSILASGCPICNKVVVMLLGVGGALTYFAPLQPVLGLSSIALLSGAVFLRIRGIRTLSLGASWSGG